MKKAVVLLSGGMDSAVALYIARRDYRCHALIFDYGQKAKREIECAVKIAEMSGSSFQVLRIAFPWKGSALLDKTIDIPEGAVSREGSVPLTYVPARNIVFLSFGVSCAEAIDAEALFIGAHELDFSNYPDCRSSFFEGFQETVRQGTKNGIEGREVKIITPLIDKTKKEIVEIGVELGVPFECTFSCYKDGEVPCGVCESCMLRAKGFQEAGIPDPLQTAKISEIFLSYQGEGPFAGSRQLFVRFYGCNRSCVFCDTPLLSYRLFTKDTLMERVLEFEDVYNELVVTGGEPLLHADFLKVFLASFRNRRENAVYLETNGTLPEELEKIIDHVDIIAMDFKLPSSTGDEDTWKTHEEFAEIAAQKELIIKAVVTDKTTMDDVKHMARIIKGLKGELDAVLQPVTPVNVMASEPEEEKLSRFKEYLENETGKNAMILGQLHPQWGRDGR